MLGSHALLHSAASVVLSLVPVAGVAALSAPAPQNATQETALTIREQGSVAIGGSVVTTPGTFDPIAQGAYNPAAQIREIRRSMAIRPTTTCRLRICARSSWPTRSSIELRAGVPPVRAEE